MGRKEPNTQRAILYRVGMMQVDIGGLDDAGGGHWRLDEAVDHDEDGCRRDQMMRVGTGVCGWVLARPLSRLMTWASSRFKS
jgi:hypothetical protein